MLSRLEARGLLAIMESAQESVIQRGAEQLGNGDVCHACGASYWDNGASDGRGGQTFGYHNTGCAAVQLRDDFAEAVELLKKRMAGGETEVD